MGVRGWSSFEWWVPAATKSQTVSRTAQSWASLVELDEITRRYLEGQLAEYPSVLAVWNERMAHLDHDSSSHDWLRFRPLRISREEDWSDWLAYLIEAAPNQLFARALFSHEIPTGPFIVEREVVAGQRRADLVIRWTGCATHLEVKVGDDHFEKMNETALLLEAKAPGPWTHYPLLPAEDLALAQDAIENASVEIKAMDWSQVALALRRALLQESNSLRWRAFAHAFCGAIEQHLLGCPGGAVNTLAKLAAREKQLRIMKEALNHE